MAGSWLSIVEGFAGMRVKKNSLHFTPRLPENWEELIFKIHFRKNIFKIKVKKNLFHCSSSLKHALYIHVNNKKLKFDNNGKASISI